MAAYIAAEGFDWFEVRASTGSAVGNPKEKIRIEPVSEPVPEKSPEKSPAETPVEVPEKVPA